MLRAAAGEGRGLDRVLYSRKIRIMSIHRQVRKVGGSLSIILPKDMAELMAVKEGSHVRLSLVGRQMVVEPEDDTLSDGDFQKAFATVLRRHGNDFRDLAEYDAGKRKTVGGRR
jgi:antitoxin component of MazEF toxin-antitoxin module